MALLLLVYIYIYLLCVCERFILGFIGIVGHDSDGFLNFQSMLCGSSHICNNMHRLMHKCMEGL